MDDQNRKPEKSPHQHSQIQGTQAPESVSPADKAALERAEIDPANPRASQAAIEITQMMFRGALPTIAPPLLAEYEKIVPGLARQIIAWTEKQSRHRQSLEQKRTEGSERRMNRGQTIAAAIAIWGVTMAAIVGVWGNQWAAIILAVVSVGGPTAALILAHTLSGRPGQDTQKKPELEKKQGG